MTSNYDNIPEELKTIQAWVCFDLTDGKKIPYTPGSDNMASSNRPTEWRSYRSALKDVESGKRQHIGFCVSSTDPYVFIDLDDPEDVDQKRVFSRIRTYAQRSVSGEGSHLICKGTFSGKGRHPAYPAAGLFKENRFILMTGDVIKKRTTINAVADEDLQSIHSWLSKGGEDVTEVELTEYVATLPDMTVFELGCDRFLKYRDLANGEWEKYEEFGNDHSTADHAFLAMLCDLTESNEQVRYLFSISGMWNEERAAKKAGHGFEGYVNRTISKIRSKQVRDAAITANITLAFTEDEADLPEPVSVSEPVKVKGNSNLIESLPEGLVKDLARYSYRTSYLPLQEASLLGSLMFMSGMCGRGFLTPTKSGLNLWLVLVGGTSCGKDEYQNGIKRIMGAVSKKVPHIRKIFGGEIVSGPGIEAVFQDTFRYISYVPEFGDTFKLLANPHAPDYVKTLSRGLLNSYNSAGKGGSSEGRRKAGGGNDEKVFIERPCLCIAGEATPESLYGSMTTRELSTGFLQRFMLLDVPLSSWSMEENKNHGAPPPKELVARLEQLALAMDTADVSGKFTVVETTQEAHDLLKKYRDTKRKEIMQCPDGLSKKEVINRAGLKALRIASVLAVAADFYTPILTVEHAKWAIDFVESTDAAVVARFDSGEIGSGQVKQESEILKACVATAKMSKKDRRALGFTKKISTEFNIIPLSILKKLVVNNAVFATDRMGAVSSFDKCVDSMVKSGVFVKLSEAQAFDHYDHQAGVLLCLTKETLSQ